MAQLESWQEILNNADTSEKCLACFKEALGEFLQFTLNDPKESDYLTFHGHFNTRYYALLKAEEEAKKAALNRSTSNT